MKITIEKILVGLIAAAIFTIVSLLLHNLPVFDSQDKSSVNVQQEKPIVNRQTDWPMFHGSQRLLGVSQQDLPDSLELFWKFKTQGEIKSSPAVVGGIVFAGSTDANIYAIDLSSGNRVWSYRTDDAVEASPCVIEGSVYVGSSDSFLYSLDAATGSLKWKYETGGKILGSANWIRSPDQNNIWILVGSYDSKLHCVDANSGQAVWVYETDNYVNGTPAVDNGVAVFGGCDGMIHIVSLADGNELSQIDAGSYIAGSAVLSDGKAYVGNYDEVFFCADIEKREILWKYINPGFEFYSSPALGNDVIVIGSRDKRVHCIGRDKGKMVWTFQTGGDVDSSPVICGDKVVVGSADGRLYLIQLFDGKKVWSYEIGQPVMSSPAVAYGMVVVGSDDGFIYAFGAKR